VCHVKAHSMLLAPSLLLTLSRNRSHFSLCLSLSFSLVMLCGCRSCIVVKLKGVALLRGLLVQHV